MRYTVEISVRGQITETRDLGEKTVIGRGSQADLIIANDGISRKHLLIEVVDGEKVYLTDLASANGTLIASQKLNPHEKLEFSTFFMPIKLSKEITLMIVQNAY